MSLADEMKEELGKKPRALSGREQITLFKQDIIGALQEGFNKKEIWQFLHSKERIDVSYKYFLKLTSNIQSPKHLINNKIIKEENKLIESKKTEPNKNKPKRKPIYNPPDEKKGFVHNPVARKDLI